MKTAIEKLIEEMESLASTQEYAMPSKAIRECIYLAYAKLPIEKQQMKEICVWFQSTDNSYKSYDTIVEEYYQNTFKK